MLLVSTLHHTRLHLQSLRWQTATNKSLAVRRHRYTTQSACSLLLSQQLEAAQRNDKSVLSSISRRS